jgi:hypothetical protein
MTYVAPPDQVVFEQGPHLDGKPLPRGFERLKYWSGTRAPSSGQPIGTRPAPWARIGEDRAGVAFLHARTSRAGVTCILAVAFASSGNQDRGTHGSVSTNEYIGHLASADPGSRIRWIEMTSFALGVTPEDRLRIFAGQPDPDDASRFTIRYELNGETGIIDGELLDPVPRTLNETVGSGGAYLRVRDGPALARIWRGP